MPEGPEVETVRQGLLSILEKKILQIEVSSHKKYEPATELFAKLLGSKIVSIKRIGKLLIWEFKKARQKYYATNAFGMTGLWRILSAELSTNWDGSFTKNTLKKRFRHFKLAFIFDKFVAIFVDARTFGNFKIHDSLDEVMALQYVVTIGPDILSDDFNYSDFITRVRGKKSTMRKQAIGKLLLNPTIIAGCGNIYKNEALYLASIHPETPAHLVSDDKLKSLSKTLVQVAKIALASGGSTLKDFENVEGYYGLMQNKFTIYGKTGKPCRKCSSLIKSLQQGGRRSYYCPKCQQLPFNVQ